MKGKTKVVVAKGSLMDVRKNIGNIGKTGYIDGYVSEGTSHFAMVVFEDGTIEPVHYSKLKALEEI